MDGSSTIISQPCHFNEPPRDFMLLTFYRPIFLSRNEKSPSIAARAFYLIWRSGRDSNPRPPA